MTSTGGSRSGTVDAPTFHEGPSVDDGDVHLRQRLFTYETADGLVAGQDISVSFTLDRGAGDVWPFVRDFNLWQNAYGYFYSGNLGQLYGDETLQLGTGTFRITVRLPGDPEWTTGDYVVLRVIPEHLIVLYQPVPNDGSTGGVSPGFHVVRLDELGGKTNVSLTMEHAMRTTEKTEEEVLAFWLESAVEVNRFWHDIFIPTLRELVQKGAVT
jgi:hypothetical protein